MKRAALISLVVAAVFAFASCGRGGEVIPRSKMSHIYKDMFLTDQWLERHPEYNEAADTMLVYEHVFRKYGYNSDDYRKSVLYYIKDPERYARLLKRSAQLMDAQARELKRKRDDIIDRRNAEIEMLRFFPERIFFLSGLKFPQTFHLNGLKYYVDSTGGSWTFDPRLGMDTAYYGPEMVLLEKCDSLQADSLNLGKAVTDSLKVE